MDGYSILQQTVLEAQNFLLGMGGMWSGNQALGDEAALGARSLLG